jgi:hypothetical protein
MRRFLRQGTRQVLDVKDIEFKRLINSELNGRQVMLSYIYPALRFTD